MLKRSREDDDPAASVAPPPGPSHTLLPDDLEDDVDPKQFEKELKPPVLEYRKEPLVSRLEAMDPEERQCIEIRINPEYVSVNQKPVKGRQLYGDLIYSSDSDLVAVLMHLGYFRMMDTMPIGMISIKAIIRAMPLQMSITGRLRNGMMSRTWHAVPTKTKVRSYKVEGCWLVKRDGTLLSLKPNIENEPDYIPSFVPSYSDRAVTTRSTTAMAERRQRNLPEQSFMFNLSNEIAMKYTIFAVADRGLRPWQWTSAKLLREAMYLETKKHRYELSRQLPIPSTSTDNPDLYSWRRCTKILSQTKMTSIGIPLPSDNAETVHDDLKWEDVKWSPSSVVVKGRGYAILRFYFVSRTDD